MELGSGSFSVDGTTKYGVNVEDKYYGGASSVSAPQIFQASDFTNRTFSAGPTAEQTIVSLTLPSGLASSKIQVSGYSVATPSNTPPRTAYSGSFGLIVKKNGAIIGPQPYPVITFAPGTGNANYLTIPVSFSLTAQGGDVISLFAFFEPTNGDQAVLVTNSYLQVVTGFA